MNILTPDCLTKENVLYDFVEKYAKKYEWKETLIVLPYARKMHEGQYRSGKEKVPYYCHPLKVACHAISIGIADDTIIASALLHDVCEDCGVKPVDLPVSDKTRNIVSILTRDFEAEMKEEKNEQEYYLRILNNKDAMLVKLLDRCNNVSEMSEGFQDGRLERYIKKTEKWFYPMFEKAMGMYPECEKEIFLLHYHMTSVLTAAKRRIKK